MSKRTIFITFAVLVALFILFAFLASCLVAVSQERMPTNIETINEFSKKFVSDRKKIRSGKSNELVYARVAKKTVEDMGYSYDETFTYFILNNALKDSASTVEAWAVITWPRINLEKAMEEGIISQQAYNIAQQKRKLEGFNDHSIAFAKAILACGKKLNSRVVTSHELAPYLKEKGIDKLNTKSVRLDALQEKKLIKITNKAKLIPPELLMSGERLQKKRPVIKYETEFEILDQKGLKKIVSDNEDLEKLRYQYK